uniref:hypothetical protein n=1 Tax=Enterocloster aldenensis TaxID=358742 RepID=UPI0011C41B3B
MEVYVVALMGLMLIYLFMLLFVFRLHIGIRKKCTSQTNAVNINRQFMDNVKTNHTYPELLNTYSPQYDNTAKPKIKKNVDFKGYFEIVKIYEKTRKI